MNKILFYLDQEAHEPLFLAIYGEQWDRAMSKLSGEGAETQLVNALGELGFTLFDRVAADSDENEENDDESSASD